MMSMSRSDRSVQYILQNFIWEDSFLQLTSGFQVSQKLDNMLGDGGGDGQVSSGGLESVLIGHPVDGVSYSFQFVGVRSARNASDFFGLVADQLLLSLFLDGDTISGLVAVGVFAGLVRKLSRSEDGDGLFVLDFEVLSGGNSHEESDQKHRFHVE